MRKVPPGDRRPCPARSRGAYAQAVDLASLLTLVALGCLLAVQPWSVLGSILLVTSAGGVRKDVAYVAGWVTALAIVATVTVLAYPGVPQTWQSGAGHAGVDLAAGAALGVWVLRRKRGGPSAGEPRWLGRLDTLGPVAAFALGAFLPTYAAVVAAVSQMLASGLSQAVLAVVAVGWILLASAGVAAPLAVLVVHHAAAPDTYARWRTWIAAHHSAVGTGLGAAVAVLLLIKGLVGLLT